MSNENFYIETARLKLVPLNVNLAEEFHTLVLDTFDTLHTWMSFAEHRPTIEILNEEFAKSFDLFEKNKAYHMGIYSKEYCKFVGVVNCDDVQPSIDEYKGLTPWDLGYWLHKDYTGKGFATEAAQALMDFVHESCKVQCFTIQTKVENIDSSKVAERLKFQLHSIAERPLRNKRSDWPEKVTLKIFVYEYKIADFREKMSNENFHIETARLKIIPLNVNLAEEFHKLILDTFDTLHAWMSFAEHRPTMESLKEDFKENFELFEKNKGFHMGVYSKEYCKFIGMVECDDICTPIEKYKGIVPWDLGYWLHKDCTGKGFATEAVQALMDLVHERCKVQYFTIHTKVENIGSSKVAERLQFQLHSIAEIPLRCKRSDWPEKVNCKIFVYEYA